MQRVILASGSPRRRELMAQIGITCDILVSDAPEITTAAEPSEIVKELSDQKAQAVSKLTAQPAETDTVFLVAADTIVAMDGEIMGKPKDAADAKRMLQELSGRTHSVFTGVTILKRTGQAEWVRKQFYTETIVYVADMTDEEIDWYIGTGDPFDKAGAYGIQNEFAAFIEKIEGDYQNVVGLPICAVYQELCRMGWKREQ